MADGVKVIAGRLVRTREALGLAQQEFCREIGVAKNVYNPFETGKRRITVDVARRIKLRFGVSLDWIYDGDPAQLPAALYRRIEEAA